MQTSSSGFLCSDWLVWLWRLKSPNRPPARVLPLLAEGGTAAQAESKGVSAPLSLQDPQWIAEA